MTERQKAILARWRVEQALAEAKMTPDQRLEHAGELMDWASSIHGAPDRAWLERKRASVVRRRRGNGT